MSIFEYDEEEHMRQEREESRQEGFEEGEKCGEERGEMRMAELITVLNRQGRTEDIVKMAADSEYRKKLLDRNYINFCNRGLNLTYWLKVRLNKL